jgi:hypothetical protein
MELWLLCTALPLNVLDHCMKLYWIPTISLQVMLRTRKMQRWTYRLTNRQTTQGLLYTSPSFVSGVKKIFKQKIMILCTTSYGDKQSCEVSLKSPKPFWRWSTERITGWTDIQNGTYVTFSLYVLVIFSHTRPKKRHNSKNGMNRIKKM